MVHLTIYGHQLWWTPKFKTDFIKFWASLTQLTSKGSEEGGKKTATSGAVKRDKKTNVELEPTLARYPPHPIYIHTPINTYYTY
jgi:hypothetical protein